MTVTSKSALAAELGITKGRVSHYCTAGMPVRSDGKLNREEAIRWVADNHWKRSVGNAGVRRAKELCGEGYAGQDREDEQTWSCNTYDGAVVWYRLGPNGETVVVGRQEPWERLGFESAEAYERWRRNPPRSTVARGR